MLSHRKVARMSCITVVAAEASGSWKEGGKKSQMEDERDGGGRNGKYGRWNQTRPHPCLVAFEVKRLLSCSMENHNRSIYVHILLVLYSASELCTLLIAI